ncbi:hypothetical protein GGI24_002455, partial [Coemansia furcata]
DAVPVDTHIWQVAQKRYVDRLAGSKSESAGMCLPPEKQEQICELARQLCAFKSPSAKAYELAQALIVTLFTPYAGWAQGMLFSDDLVDSIAATADKPKTKHKAKPKSTSAKRKADSLPAVPKNEYTAQPAAKRTGLRPQPTSPISYKPSL